MAKESEFFEEIHQDNFSGLLTAFEIQNDGSEQSAKVQVIDAHRLVPASFQKHTQAESSLKEGDSEENTLRWMRFSASIEKKRLIYLDRAIAYLDSAPQREIFGLLSGFKSAMKMHEKRNKGLASIEREVGPER